MRRTKTGSGITERTIVTYDLRSDDDRKALLDHMERGLRSFPDRVRDLEAMAADTLRSNNLPTREGRYIKVGDHWIESSGLRPRASHLRALVEAEGYADDSMVGYAARAICLIRYLNGAIRRGDAEQAALWGFDLGGLIQERFIKLVWEKRALHGHAMRPESKNIMAYNAKKSPELARQRRKWQEEATRIRAKNPELSCARVGKLVQERLRVRKSVRHICRYI